MPSYDYSQLNLEDFKKYARTVWNSEFCYKTPLLKNTEGPFRSKLPNHIKSLHLKMESTQNSGCFKIRGAACQIGEIIEAKQKKNIDPHDISLVAYTGGNYGKAFAMVCDHYGVSGTVIMPKTVPPSRINVIRSHNAVVRLAANSPNLLDLVKEETDRGKILAHPFDDIPLIGGYGSIAFELMADMKEPDVILVPCGGGGLLSGIAACGRMAGE